MKVVIHVMFYFVDLPHFCIVFTQTFTHIQVTVTPSNNVHHALRPSIFCALKTQLASKRYTCYFQLQYYYTEWPKVLQQTWLTSSPYRSLQFLYLIVRRNKFDLGRNIWCVKRLGYELIGEPYEVKVADDIRCCNE